MPMMINLNQAEIVLLGPTTFSDIQNAINDVSVHGASSRPWTVRYKKDERSYAMNLYIDTDKRVFGLIGEGLALGDIIDKIRALSPNGKYKDWKIVPMDPNSKPQNLFGNLPNPTVIRKPVISQYDPGLTPVKTIDADEPHIERPVGDGGHDSGKSTTSQGENYEPMSKRV